MASRWIEGKIAGDFQYLSETFSSQKSDACNFWERQALPKSYVTADWPCNAI